MDPKRCHKIQGTELWQGEVCYQPWEVTAGLIREKKKSHASQTEELQNTAIRGREDKCEQPAQFNCACPASVGSRACTGVASRTAGDEASRRIPEAQLVWGENGKAYWKWSKANKADHPAYWKWSKANMAGHPAYWKWLKANMAGHPAYGKWSKANVTEHQRHNLSCPSSLDGQTELGPHVCVHPPAAQISIYYRSEGYREGYRACFSERIQTWQSIVWLSGTSHLLVSLKLPSFLSTVCQQHEYS